ncbi:DnaD domain protein [Murimonas intestini]|uniref:DnaD domain protein n=1 Tax=Murimonas intestini TaxID=1337051 RepID=UPI001FA9C1F5|nr:DnaD domain protein [Murimonas intestini]
MNKLKSISLYTRPTNDVTIIQNYFLDHYLPAANGEYVKLYLFLFRCACAGRAITVSALADTFDHTEKDIRRGLSYWEKLGLLELTYGEGDELLGVSFLDLPVEETAAAAAEEQPADTLQGAQEESEYLTSPDEPAASAPASIPKPALSPDRVKALKDSEDIRQLIFIAEQYLGKTLSPSEVSNILYFYDVLHFSADLIEYLIEYCVSKGSKSARYIETVALAWSQEGIKTVQEAKDSTNLYNKNYYTILNTFGIKGRGPAKPETDYMNCWLNEYHFTLDIIQEACSRTIAQTHQPNFQYANKILEDWHKNGIKHINDIRQLDIRHQQNKKAAAPKQKAPSAPSGNKFNNFHQREYDYKKLEEQLLNR